MAKPATVFAGLKLSEQAAPTKPAVDQRLFTPPPAASQPAADQESPAAAQLQPREQPMADSRLPAVSIDLADLPYRKDTFLFTRAEFEGLEDLKLQLGRTLDRKVTKNDLARCAISYLIADYRQHGTDSVIIEPLKQRNR